MSLGTMNDSEEFFYWGKNYSTTFISVGQHVFNLIYESFYRIFCGFT